MDWLQLIRILYYQSKFYLTSFLTFVYLNSQFVLVCRSMVFEKAYCLYRLNRTQEALAVLNKEPNPDAKHKELKAQILYRMER